MTTQFLQVDNCTQCIYREMYLKQNPQTVFLFFAAQCFVYLAVVVLDQMRNMTKKEVCEKFYLCVWVYVCLFQAEPRADRSLACSAKTRLDRMRKMTSTSHCVSSMRLLVCSTVCLSVYLTVSLSVCISVSLSIHLVSLTTHCNGAITPTAEIVCHMAEKVFGSLHFSFNARQEN